MSAEPIQTALVGRFAVFSPIRKQGYYRSKLFIATTTSNLLVAAAGPLLSLIERLCISPSLPPIADIRGNIEHELHAFQSRVSGQKYVEEFFPIAYYLLCATLDELLGKSYLRLYGTAAEFNAFTPLTLDHVGPERRFFEIVHYLKHHTNQYLDLLELAYYCLIAGFEGDYHLKPDGRQQLDNLIEELFQLIQQYRVNKPQRLLKTATEPRQEPVSHKPFFMAVTLVLSVCFSLYGISHILLEHQARNVLQGHTVLAKMDREWINQ